MIKAHGEPAEATESLLVWYELSDCKQVMASKTFFAQAFPAPHNDSVTSVIDYVVPKDLVSALAEFDGSVIVDGTAGELSARCHDEQANFLAQYYAKEFADYRRKEPTPYMEKLRFAAQTDTANPDQRVPSDEDLERASEEGKKKKKLQQCKYVVDTHQLHIYS